MAQRDQLRLNRYGTVINVASSRQELKLAEAVTAASEAVIAEFGLQLDHRKRTTLTDLVLKLRTAEPDVHFSDPLPTSFMSPDGGILSAIRSIDGSLHPILISEVKRQGTNDLRATEGLKKQSMGNAIERLGKSVIGYRDLFLEEEIFPFICFGYGYDFHEGSSILDRVRTIAQHAELNTVNVHKEGKNRLARGSFFFREQPWSKDEMIQAMTQVASTATQYYLDKHGAESFLMIDDTALRHIPIF
ncbi:EcoRI family type II restriction endonuclease [Leifsonia sp. Leaf264]|uniref:EcoRI family type II restriction endonuclease n=1 Tax=Leifsonia sp. Leaf264 TaxID=1736314 RepID=UPI0006FCBA47|nr:EcoRI family type II restriction endonuclease [Leifsonia sp. Leaf264]KQO98757.1 hypothetical protein ASF30_11895 [Leifsonia sp. Leaf264]